MSSLSSRAYADQRRGRCALPAQIRPLIATRLRRTLAHGVKVVVCILLAAALLVGVAPSASAAGVRRPVSSMKPSATAERLVTHWEGFRARAYEDSAGNCTIGYGQLLHRGKCLKADRKRRITESQARQRLRGTLRRNVSAAERTCFKGVPLLQQEYDALASFFYNMGPLTKNCEFAIFQTLRARDYGAVPTVLKIYNKDGNRVAPGLVRRRASEGHLWKTGKLVFSPPEQPPAGGGDLGRLTQDHRNLAGLGYLPFKPVDTRTMKDAIRRFQAHQCLAVDGTVGAATRARLAAQVKAVQTKVGATPDGLYGNATKKAIQAWQRKHRLQADGMAGPATLKTMGLSQKKDCRKKRPAPLPKVPRSLIVGDVRSDSSKVPCYRGTRDLGVHDLYVNGKRIKGRLCAIPGFKSAGDESARASRWYIKGANGDVIVNARVSGAFSELFTSARKSGLTMSAMSSYRSTSHQRALCRADAGCRRGDHSAVGRPGFSAHESGVAVDFTMPHVDRLHRGKTCKTRTKLPSNRTWRFLEANARSYGIKQYAYENWHWEAGSRLANRC